MVIRQVVNTVFNSCSYVLSQGDASWIVDCGDAMNPDIEKIVELDADAILLSPFENSGGYGQLEKLGVPLIECAEYMETSALGRAEWMRFYGLLYGCEAQADSLFAVVEKEYFSLSRSEERETRFEERDSRFEEGGARKEERGKIWVNSFDELFRECREQQLQSLIVEGGRKTLQSFIDQDLWDEIRAETADGFHLTANSSTPAPLLPPNATLYSQQGFGSNIISYYKK